MGCPRCPLRVGWLPDALRRWRRCSPAVSSRAEAAQVPRTQGEQELHSLISVGIRTLGEELSGPARRRRGRRDGWSLLVAYRHASTQPPQPSHFTALCGRQASEGIVYRHCAASFAVDATGRRETGPGQPSWAGSLAHSSDAGAARGAVCVGPAAAGSPLTQDKDRVERLDKTGPWPRTSTRR